MAKLRDDKLTKFRPQRRNANKHTERGMVQLEVSMRKYGYVTPMTAAADGEIIDGSARAETSANVFDDDVLVVHHDGTKPVIMVRDDIPTADTPEARAISLAANRVAAVNLDFDAEVILEDLQAGVNLDDFWRKDELDELIADLTPKTTGDTEPQVDRAEELRQKWGVVSGQLWELDSGNGHAHRLICGDCTDPATVARVMGGERAQAVVTDPPYAVFGSSTGIGKNIVDDKMILPFCREVFAAAVSATDANAHVYIHCDWKSFNAWWSQLERFDLRPLNCIVWDKGDGGIGTNYTSRHEFILFLNREPKQIKMTTGGGGMRLVHGIANVQRFNVTQGDDRLHNAAKPVKLEEVFIGASTDAGGIVFDPFSGSGTTLIACENLSRRCRAVEISAAYVAVALQRWADHTGRQPVLVG